MSTDPDLEARLRAGFRDHEPDLVLPGGLVADVLAAGRRGVRRSRARWGITTVVATAAVVTVAIVAGRATGDPDSGPEVHQPSTPTEQVAPGTAGGWAARLPVGEPPDVPYLVGTTVVLPGGMRIDLRAPSPALATGAAVIGVTVAGLVLLVEQEVPEPYSFSSRYVLVGDSGVVRDLPVSTRTADGAQEAVVSPDGTQFTSGGDVIDMRDLSVVGRIPAEAEYLLSWSPAGIVYSVGSRYVLWRDGSPPIPLRGFRVELTNGTDVGMRTERHGTGFCREVVRILPTGRVDTVWPACLERLRSVSPTGRWTLTRDLRLVDMATGSSRVLTGRPITPEGPRYDKVRWEGDDTVLFTVDAYGYVDRDGRPAPPLSDLVVRCDVVSAACELATGPEQRHGTGPAIGLP